MKNHIAKRHSVSFLMYHFVCPVKYRHLVFDTYISETVKNVCSQIEERYEIFFIEVGTDGDHVHFLIQSLPKYSPATIIQRTKSILAKEIFRLHPEVKQKLWNGEFWNDGYYVNTVSKHANVSVVTQYVKNQGGGKKYNHIFRNQLKLF